MSVYSICHFSLQENIVVSPFMHTSGQAMKADEVKDKKFKECANYKTVTFYYCRCIKRIEERNKKTEDLKFSVFYLLYRKSAFDDSPVPVF